MNKPEPIRTTISIPKKLHNLAVAKQHELGFSTFSDYVQHLMREEFILREQRQDRALNDDGPTITYPRRKRHISPKLHTDTHP